ncbi:MAG: ABC transporter permease [Candidatus Omnitrophica bacterium]|nr:ABC transporter permease [Candidatus Omnitrophota bacterium]
MLRYILRRLLTILPILLVMSLLTFILMQKTSGSFYDTLKLNPQISPETIERYIKLYQLDKPLLVQYFSWLTNLFHFEFGYSFFYNIPVADVIGGRLWNTFVLSLASLILTWGVAIPLGIYAALHRNKITDRLIQFTSYIALASPTFFVAMLLLYFASQSGILPLGGMHSANYDGMNIIEKFFDVLRHVAIPATALSISSIGALQRIMRGNMLEVLGQQYILTARAKGLPENRVIYSHALRNAINPLVTILGYEFAGLLSGAALLEIICSWPGLGALMLTAVQSKDIYLVMASFLLSGFLLIIGNLLADVLLARLDPRIRYEK